MNQKNIVVIGTLEEVSLEYKGKNSDFPVLKVKIATGEKFYEFEAVGQDATVNNAVFEQAPAGTRFRVAGTVTGNRGREGGVFTRFSLISTAPDFTGVNSATGVISGVVNGVIEKAGRSGSFEIPQLGLLLADRDGIINDGNLELNFPRDGGDQAKADWKTRVGQYAELTVDLDAFITESGRSIPKYNVKSVTFHPMPEYLLEIMGLGAAPDNVVLDTDAGVDDLADAI